MYVCVCCFAVQGGQPKAYFYLDPYSRPAEKRGGAWMAEVVGQSRLMAAAGQPVRLPVAHMVCNQIPPIGECQFLLLTSAGLLAEVPAHTSEALAHSKTQLRGRSRRERGRSCRREARTFLQPA